jgi:hypothetical protein
MGVKTKVLRGDKWIAGEEKDFVTKKEDWNVYELEDGTTIKLKTIVTKIIKLNMKNPSSNDPVYSVSSGNIVTAIVREKKKKG